jgi:hypothetical protein
MFSVNLKKAEQHPAQAPELHKRIYPSKFNSAAFDRLWPRARRGGLVAGCGSLVLNSVKRSVINIGRSMFNVQSVHCSGQAEFHTRN